MISEQQKELATRSALGELNPQEQQAFNAEVRDNPELQRFLLSLEKGLEDVAQSIPQVAPPPALKQKLFAKIQGPATQNFVPPAAGLRFLVGSDTGWKALPLPGAFIKLLSLQADRGYAVLLGKLDPGVRYPAHTNVGPEDFYILTGDLHVDGRRLGPGDFHHADAGSEHGVNYSIDGCTLLAVLTVDDPLVALASR
jgi:quercetin dioxygenase-like cupin family protein